MNGKEILSLSARRLFLARLGAEPALLALPSLAPPERRRRPRRMHNGVPLATRKTIGMTRLGRTSLPVRYLDGEGMGWALQFASNYFTANQDAYGLKESDLAVVIVARHKATVFLQRLDLGQVRKADL